MTTATTKPKAKFSSRNLSAVFKAPLRSKPLPDNGVNSLQRSNNNNRMLVLGRAGVAAPAPINTPSLKRESQVHDIRVSLVPAGSNWAENADKQQKSQETETAATSVHMETSLAVPETVWTPESVAEHLHTSTAATAAKVVTSNSGRWGDDAVEHDIYRNTVHRQQQKEREFPDLKEAVEENQKYHRQGYVDRSPSMFPQHSEQHRGRATGRWAHFGEQEMQRHSQDDRWSRDRYERDEGNRWSRGIYSHCDDGHRPEESSNNIISPVPNDSHTHFSRSDARFDGVASGDRDRVLSHSPHRMDWNSGRLGRREERSSSPAPQYNSEESRFHTNRPSSSPTTLPVAADASPARAMNWHNSANDCAANAWTKTDEPATSIAKVVENNANSSSNLVLNSNPIPSQQVQLLKRPKMLFNPKTGGMVSADDKVSSSTGKKQTGNRTGEKDWKSVKPEVTSTKSNDAHKSETELQAKTAKIRKFDKTGREKAASVAVEIRSETSSDAMIAKQTSDNTVEMVSKKKRVTRATTKQSARQQSVSRATREQQPKQTLTSQTRKHQTSPIAASESCANSAIKPDKRTTSSSRTDRRSTGDKKPSSTRKVQLTSVQEVDSTEAALQRHAGGANVNAVVVSGEQKGTDVSPEEDGFETVKSRRVVLSEKKQLRQRLASGEAAARASEFIEEKKGVIVTSCANEQSKGDAVQETFDMKVKLSSKPRGKNSKDKKQKSASKQTKQSKPRTKDMKQMPVNVATVQSPIAKPTEQVAGEAPAESSLSRKKSPTTAKREPKPKKQNINTMTSESSDHKETVSGARRNQAPSKRQNSEQAIVEKVPVATAVRGKSKQVRKIYVVKTPAPSGTSTAA